MEKKSHWVYLNRDPLPFTFDFQLESASVSYEKEIGRWKEHVWVIVSLVSLLVQGFNF